VINYYIIGEIMRNGNSTDDFPIKYVATEYNLEFSSLRNTSLSTGKVIITGLADI
jgi:hypothetical protein